MTEAVIYNDPTKFSTSALQPTTQAHVVKKTFSRLYGKHDVYDGEYNLSQKILAEFLGTALFVYGVCSSNVFNEDPVAKILGSCCMGGVIIYIFGRISGAHFNPAVSLGLFLRHKLSSMELGLYILAQILGGFLGCVLLALCRRGKFKEMAGNAIAYYLITTNRNSEKKNAGCYISALLFEILGTFILVMFILASCERDNYLGPALGLAFSSVLIALSGIGGNISGCSLNPARSFAPALVQLMAKGNKDPIKQIWIYLLGPIIGAVIAAFVWPLFVYQF
jgi:aquaporin Z